MFANPRGIQTRQIVTHPLERGIAIMRDVLRFRHIALNVDGLEILPMAIEVSRYF